MDINPKQFLNSSETERSLLNSSSKEIKSDDDDPLSIWDPSLTLLGVLLAIITVLLPTVSVLLERPSPQGNSALIKQMDT
tara:strand:- start:257 stop:496 length:240 start_codon:yes stop_codon:yes gene_type:complete